VHIFILLFCVLVIEAFSLYEIVTQKYDAEKDNLMLTRLTPVTTPSITHYSIST